MNIEQLKRIYKYELDGQTLVNPTLEQILSHQRKFSHNEENTLLLEFMHYSLYRV
jgi:hypothetical protein